MTVTTVTESPANLHRFVRRTLSSGVDHMVVFVDDTQTEVAAALKHPHVTVVQPDAAYWGAERPEALADRRLVNANVACAAVAAAATPRWLFHLDADEALAFDRDTLLAVEGQAVRFPTMEAVARRTWRDREPLLFKRPPERVELHALSALGVIERPEVESLFRGHSLGRPGVRPAADARFREHSAYELPDRPIDAVVPAEMYLLNNDSCCLEDFMDRWRDYRPGSDAAGDSSRDAQLGAAFHLISTTTRIDEAERRRRLGSLFDRHIADDVKPLRKLGLVVRTPLRKVTPRPLPVTDVRRIEGAFEELFAVDKTDFRSTPIEETVDDAPPAARTA